jgi:hypothetical protein
MSAAAAVIKPARSTIARVRLLVTGLVVTGLRPGERAEPRSDEHERLYASP